MSGPVRTPDEILPADAATGAGPYPAGRPVVCPRCGTPTIVSDDGELVSCRDLMCGWRQWKNWPRLLACSRCCGHTDVFNECELTCSCDCHQRPAILKLPETAREHVRNALQLLAGGDRYSIGNTGRVVYDAADVDAAVARLTKALA